MPTDTTRASAARGLATLLAGAVASAAIWLAGAGDVAFLGFILAAVAGEAGGVRRCRPRRLGRTT